MSGHFYREMKVLNQIKNYQLIEKIESVIETFNLHFEDQNYFNKSIIFTHLVIQTFIDDNRISVN